VRTIPQRELRNNIGRVLREVEAGERLRITVDGRPVADLVPIGGARRTFVSRADISGLLARAPLDPAFAADLEALTGATIDEL
jgi:prevent-host-death family protein